MDFQQFLDGLTVPLVCFVVPGILFVLNGVRVIKSKERLSVGRDSHFRWKRPVILSGKRAVKEGQWDIIFGIALLSIGLCPLLSRLL
jgi:hypothetical protein